MSRGLTKEQVDNLQPSQVLDSLRKVMLIDGYDFVVDTDNSKGMYLVDKKTNKKYLDFFTYFASSALGMNHPKMCTEEFIKYIGKLALNKINNSSFYSLEMGKFVSTLERVAMPKEFTKVFFISGGALAVENALKASIDWKVRKNIKAGLGEIGTKVIHFKEAFHGRTGYTMSLTNTDPIKVQYYPKFDWPRITTPKCTFPLEGENLKKTIELENKALEEIKEAIKKNPNQIACLIIEPIQGEGGDNHYRAEFMQALREITLENDIMFICDEVQTGIGSTGKMWGYQHYGIVPDMITFGKKAQVCGFMSTDRIMEVEDNVFMKSSRIFSTWGGNYVDMIRAQKILEIIEEDQLVEKSALVGEYLLEQLLLIQNDFPKIISNTRGKGLFCAIDFPDKESRKKVRDHCYENGLIVIPCGPLSLRCRPPLVCEKSHVDEFVQIMRKALQQL
ncbi:aminotransferase [Anaeramoeba flamelloides]|uniref:L-lysine-epsilon aminotransferase n=1 Tax=Anaeramoeba flamelloides TaxID=1746091 RepID=A0AAV7YD69_9EUKA|nr:aminotransferase [Anaeramoeba flamelloides]KAJ6244351.1 aminotransferase [Anaeramoeba flamelloides]